MKSGLTVTINNQQNKLIIHTEKIKRLAQKVIAQEKKNMAGQINICFTDDTGIKKINAKFLGIKEPTDVLAFDNRGKNKNEMTADIIISAQTAQKNAREFDTCPEYELKLYLVHGILHILGYDDGNRAESKLMRKKENCYVH